MKRRYKVVKLSKHLWSVVDKTNDQSIGHYVARKEARDYVRDIYKQLAAEGEGQAAPAAA